VHTSGSFFSSVSLSFSLDDNDPKMSSSAPSSDSSDTDD